MMLSFHEEEEGLPESFLSNFPSLIKVDIHAKVTDPSVAKSMMGCLLSSLKANGEQGPPNPTHYQHKYSYYVSIRDLRQLFRATPPPPPKSVFLCPFSGMV